MWQAQQAVDGVRLTEWKTVESSCGLDLSDSFWMGNDYLPLVQHAFPFMEPSVSLNLLSTQPRENYAAPNIVTVWHTTGRICGVHQ
jgi:hypothetical protein